MEPDGENANTLEFGEGFFAGDDELTAMKCLSNVEVAMVLDEHKARYEVEDRVANPAFTKTLQYVKRYGPNSDRETTLAASSELRAELAAFEQYTDQGPTKLHEFEIAALTNLMQADSQVEEAIALIPSLGKFNEDEVESILEIIRKHVSSRMYA